MKIIVKYKRTCIYMYTIDAAAGLPEFERRKLGLARKKMHPKSTQHAE